MLLRENELARRAPAALELRATALPVEWNFPELVAADGQELRCVFSASVRPLPDRTERQALEEALLHGRNAVTAEDVSRHFHPALHAAATRVARAHAVGEWIETELPRQAMITALKSAAIPVAFACGVELLPPFEAEFHSGTYQRRRVAAMQQALAEEEAASQIERLAKAADLLRQFNALRQAAPELSAGRVLEQVNVADRGALMRALLMAGTHERANSVLWAVAGHYLVRIDVPRPVSSQALPRPDLFSLPPALGPLRSVRATEVEGRRILLVGAQGGFFCVAEETPGEAVAYSAGGFESDLGFNGVLNWPARREFVATHSELGIVCWKHGETDAPALATRPAAMGILPNVMDSDSSPPSARSMTMSLSMGGIGRSRGPRNLTAWGENFLAFSAGGKVFRWDGAIAQGIAENKNSDVVRLIPRDENIEAIHEDGSASVIDPAGKVTPLGRRAGAVRSAALLPWLDESRLLLATEAGPIQCVGFDDPLVTQFEGPYRGLRMIAGSTGLVAAVSPDRQRLVFWNAWDGREPAAEVFLGAQLRHRIADIAFS